MTDKIRKDTDERLKKEKEKARKVEEERLKKEKAEGEIIDDLEEAEGKVIGKGIDTKLKGLYDSQINEIMRPLDKFGYLGTFSSDELNKVAQKII